MRASSAEFIIASSSNGKSPNSAARTVLSEPCHSDNEDHCGPRYPRTVAVFIHLAMIRIMLKRLVASSSS